MKAETPQATKLITIKRPAFQEATFAIRAAGVPLVVHRFSEKVKEEMLQKMAAGSTAKNKKVREPRKAEDICNAARYISKDNWDGVQASAFRNAAIEACRLCGYKMVMAKMSVFVVADGYDAKEPQIPLVRIIGSHVQQEDMARVETGQPYVTVRPAYHDWKMNLRMRWDADQFTVEDISNLLMRVGMQVGIGEGRPFSKNSAGMGWGLFNLEEKPVKVSNTMS